MKTDILIVGGGLAGLRLADLLHAEGIDFQLVEARDRFGGRILTERMGEGYYDMGPTWFWPGQPSISTLIQNLGLTRFDQFSRGALISEDERGQVHRGRGFASMQGSWRLEGGLGALTDTLAERLPSDRCHLNASVTAITRSSAEIVANLSDGRTIQSRQTVIALPPRLAAEAITFSPALPDAAMKSMSGTATWMAGQAKAVAVYDTPFWREEGLSGDAMSRRGPMVEIHDASPDAGGPYALFGFIGIPPSARADQSLLRTALLDQLGRLFGPIAAEPRELYVKDWAYDAFTATKADSQPVYSHPHYGLPPSLQNLWDGTLQFGGSEVAVQFGGFVEGALEAAETAAHRIQKVFAEA